MGWLGNYLSMRASEAVGRRPTIEVSLRWMSGNAEGNEQALRSFATQLATTLIKYAGCMDNYAKPGSPGVGEASW